MKFYCYRCDENLPCVLNCPPADKTSIMGCPFEITSNKKGVLITRAAWSDIQR